MLAKLAPSTRSACIAALNDRLRADPGANGHLLFNADACG